MKNFFRGMLEVKHKIELLQDVRGGRVYLRLEHFVSECSYTSYKDAKVLVKLLLLGLSAKKISKNMGISESTVGTHTQNLSSILYELFGLDFFSYFNNIDQTGSIEEISRRLDVAENGLKPDNVLPMQIYLQLVELTKSAGSVEGLSIDDCPLEVDFLYKYSNKRIESDLSLLSAIKMKYLLDVLSGREGTFKERYSLIKELERI